MSWFGDIYDGAAASAGVFAGVIDAKVAFGVKADNVTDDTAAIQAALDAATYPVAGLSGNDVPRVLVMLPPGRIKISSPLKMNPNQALRGHGPSGTYLVNTSNTTDAIQLKTGTEVQCEVSELGIINSGTATAGSGINFTNSSAASILGDSRHVIHDVVIVAPFVGVTLGGAGTENRVHRVTVQRSLSTSFVVSATDSFLSDLTAGQPGVLGLNLSGANTRGWGIKVYGGGNGSGAAITLAGAGRHEFAVCEVQDYNGPGYEIGGAQCTLTSAIADSCATAGFIVDAIGYGSGSSLKGCVSFQRAGGTYQAIWGFKIQSLGGCSVDGIASGYSQSAVQVLAGTANTQSYVNVNNQRGIQAVAYAATFRANPWSGGTVLLGSLTGGISLQNPWDVNNTGAGCFVPEQELTFILPAASSGGPFTVTFDTDFVTNGALTIANSIRTRISFRYDSDNAKWREVSRLAY